MSRSGGHTEHFSDPGDSNRRSFATVRTLTLLALASVVGAGGLLAGRFRSTSEGPSDGTRDPVLLSVAEPVPNSLTTEPQFEASTPPGSHPVSRESDQAVTPPNLAAGSDSVANGEGAASDDERLRKLILGSWQQSYYGTRVLTVLPDGKAKMVIRPDSVWAFAFGQQIDLDMFWAIENGRIDYGYTGGTPKEKVELAAKTWGDRWDEQILELTDSRLVLLCEDGKTRSEWDRASTDKPSPAASKDRGAAEGK
jgi:hypothetical protein